MKLGYLEKSKEKCLLRFMLAYKDFSALKLMKSNVGASKKEYILHDSIFQVLIMHNCMEIYKIKLVIF